MKKFLLSLIFFAGLQIVNGQIVPSSCEAPDSIIAKYKDDADRLAVRKIFSDSSSYMDSTHIPKPWSDTVLNALVAVYNATVLPARDTVINMFNIHTFPNPDLDHITVAADSNLAWMHQLHNNIIPTGEASVDSLISNYHLNLTDYFACDFVQYHIAVFHSDSNYNIVALSNRFEMIPGVNYSEPNSYFGDGNNITDSVNANFVELIYSLGWGDCPSGCIARRYWKFHIYYDCSVEYIGSYGSPLIATSVTEILHNKFKVYPNPFKEKIFVDNVHSTYEYRLCNLLGQVVRSGRTSEAMISNLDDLPNGIFFLRLMTDDQIGMFELVRE
ncbi:MAG TPA: T9SS type A sorting domain-containing protein [Chitinophagales bacterium]|nr:T9SS type A sorting domain-containing protein [Chitinophagales bacterium]